MNPCQQRGAVLVVSLILLVLVTLFGMLVVRNVANDERLAGFIYDRNLALQAAEAALREGEAVAAAQARSGNGGFPPYDDRDSTCPVYAINFCINGLCAKPDKDCTPRWLATNFYGWRYAPAVGTGSLMLYPQYFVEYLGNTFPCSPYLDCSQPANCNCFRYRITARSQAAGRAQVMLQSVFAATP
ncbi:MAG: pilus assembly protein [Caldilinea sp.]